MTKKTVYIETSVVSLPDGSTHGGPAGGRFGRRSLSTGGRPRGADSIFIRPRSRYRRPAGGFERRGRGGSRRWPTSRSLPITEAVSPLATARVRGAALPDKAVNDALHVAVAAVHGVDYLLTWNYRHLDNAETKPAIRDTCARHGHAGPEICTPRELMGGLEDGG